MFDRFYRGDVARTGEGTGLGLAIVRAIAEALAGTASVRSHPGAGATFVVEVPLGPPVVRRPVPAESDTPSEGDEPTLRTPDGLPAGQARNGATTNGVSLNGGPATEEPVAGGGAPSRLTS